MSLTDPPGIPRIIHQTWRDRDVPGDMGDPQSWQTMNPDWTYMFWTDADLLHFMQTERPDLVDLFQSYPNPVQRADLARYCLLQRHGGVYADVDTRCLGPLEPFAGDTRVILCEEPRVQAAPALERGLSNLWFNGTMASPAGHPFWVDVISKCELMGSSRRLDVLESTGPLLLSAAVEGWPNKTELSLNASTLFAGLTSDGKISQDKAYGPYGHLRISEHLWKNSWIIPRRQRWIKRMIGRLRKFRHRTVGFRRLDPQTVQSRIDQTLLNSRLPNNKTDQRVTVLIPARNSAEHLPRCFELLRAMKQPKAGVSVIFGLSESEDNTHDQVSRFIEESNHLFRSVCLERLNVNTLQVRRSKRWKRKWQAKRRAGIARVRNALLGAALEQPADWILWIDSDLTDYPPDILYQLMAQNEKIVVPNCVLELNGPSFDLNSFLAVGEPTEAEYYRHVCGGILQPKCNWYYRRHLCDLRYLRRVPLNGVGGTMLLVHADVHRAGVTFSERPYKDLIETEAFGQLARDVGVTPIGLPHVQVVHANS